MTYVATGSSIERLIRCASSIGLSHIHFATAFSERGTVIHSYLEGCADGDRELALAAVPEEWRDACAAIDLSGLDIHLSLTAEVAIAYDVETDTARELGRGAGRVYETVTDSEIPCCLDVVGVREEEVQVSPGVYLQRKRRIGLVVDWKTGWLTRKKRVENDWQLKFGALAVARLYDLDVVEVQLINLSEGKPYVQRRVYTIVDLAQIAVEVGEFYDRAVEVRSLHAAGKLPAKYELGEWCEQCPARDLCPARLSLVRAALDRKPADIARLSDEEVADLYRRLTNAKRLINQTLEQLKGIVMAPGRGPVFLSEESDGKLRYLAPIVSEGNEQVDGPITYEVVAKMLGEEYARIAAPPDATKKGIKAAVRKAREDGRVRRGYGEKTEKAILAELRKRGGATKRAPKMRAEEIVVEKELPGVDDHPALPEET